MSKVKKLLCSKSNKEVAFIPLKIYDIEILDRHRSIEVRENVNEGDKSSNGIKRKFLKICQKKINPHL